MTNMNAHIEYFHRIFEDDSLSRWHYENYAQNYEAVTDFMIFYNERRMHFSILDLSPKEVLQENKQMKKSKRFACNQLLREWFTNPNSICCSA